MQIDIPNEMLKSLVLDQLPTAYTLGGTRAARDNSWKLKETIILKVLDRMGEIELPVISKEELRAAVLEKMAERAISSMEDRS